MFGITQNENATQENLYADWTLLGIGTADFADRHFQQIFGVDHDSVEVKAMERIMSALNIMDSQRPIGL